MQARTCGLLLSLCLCSLATTCCANTLFGTTGYSNSSPDLDANLVTISPLTGNVSPVASVTAFHPFVTGLDFTADGSRLFGAGSTLYVADPTTGHFTEVGPLTLNGTDKILMASMTISPSGEMLAVGNSDRTLYAIDPATGHLSVRGTFTDSVRAIEFAPDGTLYGGFANLFQIDPSNAAILADLGRFGPVQATSSIYISEMDFSMQGLRGVQIYLGEPTHFTAKLFDINPSGPSGNLAELVTAIPEDVVNIASVPEPATFSLVTLGALIFAASRFNRRGRKIGTPFRRRDV